MRFSTIIFLLLLICLSGAQVIDTPDGKVEFIGLRRWSVEKIIDTLAVIAPGVSIDRCAGLLKEAGFPEASLFKYSWKNGKMYSVITIVEPEYARFVKYKTFTDSISEELPQWKGLIDIYRRNPFEMQLALNFWQKDLNALKESKFTEALSSDRIRLIQSKIASYNTQKDKELAIWILNNDPLWINRAMAAVVLINFPQSDLVWWSLMDALRDANARVSSMAISVLNHFSQFHPEPVTWSPLSATLYYLLNGTNLFAFPTVLRVLTKTNFSDSLLVPLISQTEGYLIFAYLKANNEKERQLAYEFLVSATGKDFGYDGRKWWEYLKGKGSLNN
ncbi:hypothetical protein [Caldithrix abyssi]